MFHDIPAPILARMHYLEEIDRRDRTDGTPRLERLRQIPPETGRFLALMAAGAPPGAWVEIGTSAGYSALWLAVAARAQGRRLTTFEILPAKVTLALETLRLAGVEDVVDLICGDALTCLDAGLNMGWSPDLPGSPAASRGIAFCFLDAEKEIYADCYEAVVPRMVPGGLLIADNAINHQQALAPILDRALHDERVDALVVPIGKGELVCRRL